MLKKFTVENFKGFQNILTLDLEADNYDFNPEVIKNNCISKVLFTVLTVVLNQILV